MAQAMSSSSAPIPLSDGILASDAEPLPAGLTDKGLEDAGLEILSQFRASAGSNRLNPCDPIFAHPRIRNAAVYCGGWSAAKSLEELGRRNIRRIVNCQDMTSENFFENQEIFERAPRLWVSSHDPSAGRSRRSGPFASLAMSRSSQQQQSMDHHEASASISESNAVGGADDGLKSFKLRYFRFHINGVSNDTSLGGARTSLRAKIDSSTEENVFNKCKAFFDFVDEGLESGESVLIHCAAGMHRAGGASVGYLMHRLHLGYDQALRLAQSRRRVINPYHKGLLDVVASHYEQHGWPHDDTADGMAPGS